MLTAIVETTEYQIDDGDSYGLLVAHDGWGMSSVIRHTLRAQNEHGDTDYGYLLNPRFGTLVFEIPGESLSDLYTRRQSLLNIFHPGKTVKLKWQLPNGQTRQIDTVFDSEMQGTWDAQDWAIQKMAIVLKASDPTFYNPAQALHTIAPGGGANAWEIEPWAIEPWNIGGATLDYTEAIAYTGSFLAYPLIRIEGPITNPVITNQALGVKLDFTGTSIGTGEWIEIDTSPRAKTVLDDEGINMYSALSSDSSLTGFYIAADDEVSGGNNSIKFEGTATNQLTRILFRYYTKYLGI